MKKRRIKPETLRFLVLAMISCLCVATVLYNSYGHVIIKAAYDCKKPKILNRHASHPIEHYYEKFDKIFNRAVAWTLFAMLAIYVMRLAVIRGVAAVLLANIAAVLVVFEIIIALELAFPSMPRMGLGKFLRNIYESSYRNIIQLEPAFALYDPELTYTLKPGVFVFSNPEFKNEFRINSIGVRDDEPSLNAPDIVMLGDSYAMGWGVGQEETFASLVEKASGLRVLNAAVASYGTAREMLALGRIDTSRLKYLVIQYDANDYDENLAFYKGGNSLKISDEASYNDTVKYYNKARRYYPGKYIRLAFQCMLKGAERIFGDGIAGKAGINPGECELFINTIIKSGNPDISGAKLIVVGREEFISSLRQKVRSREYPSFIKEMDFVSYPAVKERWAYYSLDGHLTASGHRVISSKLLEIIPAHN